jgi:hypothetical protein
MRIGSEAHRELFCRSFIATHRQYDPEKLPWPDLDGPALECLQGLPFWDEAVATEQEAGLKIRAYGETIRDPLLREAITLQAAEEMRHAALIDALIQRYDIALDPRPAAPLPADLEQAFIDVGYGECIDSFFAFGFFAIARGSGFFPEALLTLIEPILEEEARHIVFFVNWEAYHQRRRGRGLAPLQAVRALRYYGRAVRRRLGALRQANGDGFTLSGSRRVAVDLSPASFLETCLAENARRMAAFDAALLRPRLVPTLAHMALRSLTMCAWIRHRRGRAAA